MAQSYIFQQQEYLGSKISIPSDRRLETQSEAGAEKRLKQINVLLKSLTSVILNETSAKLIWNVAKCVESVSSTTAITRRLATVTNVTLGFTLRSLGEQR